MIMVTVEKSEFGQLNDKRYPRWNLLPSMWTQRSGRNYKI